MSQAQDWRKSIDYWLKPVPADESEAMIRDFLDDIPIIGDLFYRLAETVTAIEKDDSFAAMVYGANLLLPFDLPFTHMLVYEVEGKRPGGK